MSGVEKERRHMKNKKQSKDEYIRDLEDILMNVLDDWQYGLKCSESSHYKEAFKLLKGMS